jgi:hypothetical protein
MSVFEILMLICFGFAWPTSIYKSLKSKSIEGKSILFLYIILLGYLMGMGHKIFFNFDFVIILYGINFLMVFADLLIYYNNKKNIALKER